MIGKATNEKISELLREKQRGSFLEARSTVHEHLERLFAPHVMDIGEFRN